MHNLSHKQELYRSYLCSPVWQAKRIEALTHYGAICNRCREHGTDVHHKTYKRVGGNELMADLEILCRSCHEAHHRIEKAMRPRRSRRKGTVINKFALARYLTTGQREVLKKQFNLLWSQIYFEILNGERKDIIAAALKMSGKKKCVEPKFSAEVKPKFGPSQQKYYSRLLA